MSELVWYVVKIVVSIIIGCFLFGFAWYYAGKMFSAGFHVTKLKLLRELISSKETDRESKS